MPVYLRFLNNQKFNGELIICEGSERFTTPFIFYVKNINLSFNVKVLTCTKRKNEPVWENIINCIKNAFPLVSKNYIGLVCDDDFVNIEFLVSACQVLKDDKETTFVYGKQINFFPKKTTNPLLEPLSGIIEKVPNLKCHDVVNQAIEFHQNGFQLLYAVTRKPILKKFLNLKLQKWKNGSLCFDGMYFNTLLLSGKGKYIPICHIFRTFHKKNTSKYNYPGKISAILSGSYASDLNSLIENTKSLLPKRKKNKAFLLAELQEAVFSRKWSHFLLKPKLSLWHKMVQRVLKTNRLEGILFGILNYPLLYGLLKDLKSEKKFICR